MNNANANTLTAHIELRPHGKSGAVQLRAEIGQKNLKITKHLDHVVITVDNGKSNSTVEVSDTDWRVISALLGSGS